MSALKIKACGMTQIKQVERLSEMRVDYAGFIFYEKSPRYVRGKIQPEVLKALDAGIERVGVFVNEEYDVIMRTVSDYGLTTVQLHGDESPEHCKHIAANIKTIKAFRLAGDEELANVLQDYSDAADLFLFDTKSETYGGTGRKFNWEVLQNLSINKPFFLSGGIGMGDEPQLLHFWRKQPGTQDLNIDLNSRFELEPGIKDLDLLKTFLGNLRA